MDGKFKTKNGKLIYLRTAINSDFKSIRNIDIKSFDPEWPTKKFETHRDSTRVAIIKNRVVGFWIATLETNVDEEEYVNLLRLAVTPSFCRKHVGTALMLDMLANYNQLMCVTILTDIQEAGQFFLASQRFRHIKNLRKIDIPGIGKVSSYFFKRTVNE